MVFSMPNSLSVTIAPSITPTRPRPAETGRFSRGPGRYRTRPPRPCQTRLLSRGTRPFPGCYSYSRISSLAPISARLASGLLQEADVGEHHPPVHGLAHVVDRERGDGHRREGLHLDPGLSGGLDSRRRP